ncbi:MAG: S41 family peptidase [Minisyncoccia bacterium]
MKKIKQIIAIVAAVLIISGVWVVGFFIGTEWGWNAHLPSPFNKIINREKPAELPSGDMSIFWDTWKVILQKYVNRQDLNTNQMIEGATKGLVDSLGDPFSEFLNADETNALSQELTGEFFGVGMEISRKDNAIVVVSPLPNTPAEKAGLQPNDIILKINNQETSNISSQEAANLIRGPQGTTVTLTIYRPSWNEAKEVKLTREKITVPSLQWQMLNNNIAYLRIYSFDQPLELNFTQAALEILQANPKGLIIDLRNNPGGYLDSVVNISGWLLPKGAIVLKEDFGNDNVTIYRATGNGLLKDIPTVVLVNEGTASAAEILAGALRDERGIELIGAKTFGKGSVQELVPIINKDSVKITIAKWLTPHGTIIQNNGLTPDKEVKNAAEIGSYSKIDLEKDTQLQAALGAINNILQKTN